MTKEIEAALAQAYAFGSMASTPLGKSKLASDRMVEVLEKIKSLCGGTLTGKKILEIGCGTGELLHEIQCCGAEVVGVEIGPQGREAMKNYGFTVIDQPFVPGLLSIQLDGIISYGCLEHIADLETLFEASRASLRNGGIFFHVVPNTEYHYGLKTLDHLAHEHVNYFTPGNGIRLLQHQGLKAAESATSKAGNELFLWGFNEQTASLSWPGEDVRHIRNETEQLETYAGKVRIQLDQIIDQLSKLARQNETFGFYAGGFEYAAYLPGQRIRFFDGDSFKHGKSWLKGLPAIESPLSLIDAPVDHLIVCKSHYFASITKYLRNDVRIPKQIKVHCLDDMFGH